MFDRRFSFPVSEVVVIIKSEEDVTYPEKVSGRKELLDFHLLSFYPETTSEYVQTSFNKVSDVGGDDVP